VHCGPGEQADYQCGCALGRRWAEQSAEAPELQLLEQLRDELGVQPQYDWDNYFNEQEGSAYGTDENLFFATNPDVDGVRQAARDFWEGAVGDSLQQAANRGTFLKGFAEGALEIWLSVKDEL
jgi:hypothetical protein